MLLFVLSVNKLTFFYLFFYRFVLLVLYIIIFNVNNTWQKTYNMFGIDKRHIIPIHNTIIIILWFVCTCDTLAVCTIHFITFTLVGLLMSMCYSLE